MIRLIIALMFAGSVYADNEIYIDQSGDNVNIDLEQLGSSNIIGGLNSTNGSMTAAVLTGGTWTLDINQIGSSNLFLTDGILGSNFTGFFEFDGDSNDFTIQVDPTNTYGADGSNLNVDVTGDSNDFTLNVGTTALTGNLDLDWIINGSSNTFDFDIKEEMMMHSFSHRFYPF